MLKYRKPISIYKAQTGRKLAFQNPETGEVISVDYQGDNNSSNNSMDQAAMVGAIALQPTLWETIYPQIQQVGTRILTYTRQMPIGRLLGGVTRAAGPVAMVLTPQQLGNDEPIWNPRHPRYAEYVKRYGYPGITSPAYLATEDIRRVDGPALGTGRIPIIRSQAIDLASKEQSADTIASTSAKSGNQNQPGQRKPKNKKKSTKDQNNTQQNQGFKSGFKEGWGTSKPSRVGYNFGKGLGKFARWNSRKWPWLAIAGSAGVGSYQAIKPEVQDSIHVNQEYPQQSITQQDTTPQYNQNTQQASSVPLNKDRYNRNNNNMR